MGAIQTSIFDVDYTTPTIDTLEGSTLRVRALCTVGGVATDVKVVMCINDHLVAVEVLDMLNGSLSSKYQIVDIENKLCIRPGDSVSDMVSDFMKKYDPATYKLKLKKFMELV